MNSIAEFLSGASTLTLVVIAVVVWKTAAEVIKFLLVGAITFFVCWFLYENGVFDPLLA